MALSDREKRAIRGSIADDVTAEELISKLDQLDSLVTNFNALLAKLDADAGVTDTDYASSLAVS